MPTFDDPKELAAHLKKAVDATLYETIRRAQAELGSKKVSPYDTGRFRSSWFASEGSASSAVAPEGADSPNTDAAGLRVDASKSYHLTNSLEYAQSVAIEGKVISQSPNWFHEFRDVAIPKIMGQSVKAAKEQYEL